MGKESVHAETQRDWVQAISSQQIFIGFDGGASQATPLRSCHLDCCRGIEKCVFHTSSRPSSTSSAGPEAFSRRPAKGGRSDAAPERSVREGELSPPQKFTRCHSTLRPGLGDQWSLPYIRRDAAGDRRFINEIRGNVLCTGRHQHATANFDLSKFRRLAHSLRWRIATTSRRDRGD